MKRLETKIFSIAFALCMTVALSACANTALPPSGTLNPGSETPSDGMPDRYESNPNDEAALLKDEIVIESSDINDTLKITIQSDGELASFNFDDIEKIIIPKSGDDGYYEAEFWLTPDAVLKADAVVSYMSDFPIDISVNGETFKFFSRDDALHHYSRTFSSASEGLKGFDCPLFESKITRENFQILFTK